MVNEGEGENEKKKKEIIDEMKIRREKGKIENMIVEI